jgi:hypothetical protein
MLNPDDQKYLFSGNYRRVLTIRQPTTADGGVYRCEAVYHRPSTPASQDIRISSEARLVVQGLFIVFAFPRFDVNFVILFE